MSANWSSHIDSGAAAASVRPYSYPRPAAPSAAAAAVVDDEDVVIADLFQQSQQTCVTKQRRQQHTRGQQHSTQQPTQPQTRRPSHSHSHSQVQSQPQRVAESLSVDSLFCSIPGPIRRVWLQTQRSSDSRRSKRRRPNAAMVDLTSDERLDEWQRAGELIAQRQPSWRSMVDQHCSLQALLDTQLSDSSAPSSYSSSRSSVPVLFVRVDSLTAASYLPSPLSTRQLQLAEAAKQQLHAAGVLRGRLAGMEAGSDSSSSAAAAVSASLLSGYHSASVSDGRCVLTADVHDSLCRSVSGSSIGGVLSVGCYVLLSDVAVLNGSDGRPPHLVVQRYNVCAVQQPPPMDGDDDETADSAARAAHYAHTASPTQQPVAGPSPAAALNAVTADSSRIAAAYGEASDELLQLDWGDD